MTRSRGRYRDNWTGPTSDEGQSLVGEASQSGIGEAADGAASGDEGEKVEEKTEGGQGHSEDERTGSDVFRVNAGEMIKSGEDCGEVDGVEGSLDNPNNEGEESELVGRNPELGVECAAGQERVEEEEQEGVPEPVKKGRMKSVAVKKVGGYNRRRVEKRKELVNESDEGGLVNKKDEFYLPARTSPSAFCKVVRAMSASQRMAMETVGMGGALHLQVGGFPRCLGYWLLDSLMEERGIMYIQLDEGRRLNVRRDDVNRVFGFPNVGEKLVLEKRISVTPEVNAFRKQFSAFVGKEKEKEKEGECGEPTNRNGKSGVSPKGKGRGKKKVEGKSHMQRKLTSNDLKVSDLVKILLSTKKATEQYKLNFIVLFYATMVEGNFNSKLNHKIVNKVRCAKDFLKYNWCRHFIRILKDSVEMWTLRKKSHFTGPITFLLILYADRIKSETPRVARKTLSLKGWTTRLLIEREEAERKNGGFGKGELLPVCEVDEPDIVESLVESGDIDTDISVTDETRDSDKEEDEVNDDATTIQVHEGASDVSSAKVLLDF